MQKASKSITFSPTRFAVGSELWGARQEGGRHVAYLVGRVARVTSAAVTFVDGTMRGAGDSTPSFQTREQAEEWLKEHDEAEGRGNEPAT